MVLVVHLLLGFRRLNETAYYADDPFVCRVLGLRRLPSVATISRTLAAMDIRSSRLVQELSTNMALASIERENLRRVTLDFDGSVQYGKRHAEGTAVGFCKKKKGARGYYNLYCTVAQTQQFLAKLDRPGNVHDSNGAKEFIATCVQMVRGLKGPHTIEARFDSAFFSDELLTSLDAHSVEYTMSAPFERFPELKAAVEARTRWYRIDDDWSYYELKWKPQSWPSTRRFIVLRRHTRKQIKEPLQLDLFQPQDFEYEFTMLVTNKTCEAPSIMLFHHGRGTQEGIFAEAKQHAALDVIPVRTLAANQIYTTCTMMAHNLGKEIQMLTAARDRATEPKRPALWIFKTLDTLRHTTINRAGRLIHPNNQLTLVFSANEATRKDITHMMEVLTAQAEAA